MEDERLFDERKSIRDSGKSLKKYGSTCNHFKRQEDLIKHVVIKGETLQGIALKYGVTTEKIRRANRLFASDSLFLREFLMIPVPRDTGSTSSFYSSDERPGVTHRASIAGLPSASQEYSFQPGSPDEKKTFDDFLNRVDSSLANIKKDVERTSENSQFGRDTDEIFTRRRPTSRLRQSASVGGIGTVSGNFPQPITEGEGGYHATVGDGTYRGAMGETVVMAQGRRVKSSLQRLQRTQDDWFQL